MWGARGARFAIHRALGSLQLITPETHEPFNVFINILFN